MDDHTSTSSSTTFSTTNTSGEEAKPLIEKMASGHHVVLFKNATINNTKTLTFYLSLISFFTVYCIQPLLIDALKFQGFAKPTTVLFLYPHYMAMFLSGIFSKNANIYTYNISWQVWKKGLWLGIIDFLHQFFEKAGLMFAGSSVYILISNSSIIWTALISAVIIKRYLSPYQWASLLLVTIGLGLKVLDLQFDWNGDSIGVVFTLIAALLHALTSVLNEKFLRYPEDIPGPILVFMMGIFNMAILTFWLFVWTIPRWEVEVVNSIKENNGNVYTICVLMCCLFACGMINANTQWYLMKKIGSVSVGVIKGFKAAAVFLFGHYLFCHLQPSQCLTSGKVISAAICITGVIAYSISTSYNKKVVEQNKGEKIS